MTIVTADIAQFIPFDKSFLNRMGVLDLLNSKQRIFSVLESHHDLGDDMLALGCALRAWPISREIDVGESGTLRRFLQYLSWKHGLGKRFIRHGTLVDRRMCDDPSIVNWSQRELLTLDNRTSQWASAAALCGDTERLPEPPFKLRDTYDAIDFWNACERNGTEWQPRIDQTILHQAEAFVSILNGDGAHFEPKQAEDFCFAYVLFNYPIVAAKHDWPSLRGHESDRFVEARTSLLSARDGTVVQSRDHRIVQAIAMWARHCGRKVDFEHPDCVSKSWPKFWEFLSECV